MTLHHTQEATFELPEGLKDRTVHMFALSDTGPSAFNLVLSRAADISEETLEAFVDHLVRELTRALPKFTLRERLPREVDGQNAIELVYGWRQEGQFVEQRQVVTLLPETEPGTRAALMLTGTCPKAFTPEWTQAFDTVLASVKLRRAGQDAPAPAATTLPHCVFALSTQTRVLHVLPDAESASRRINALEVADHGWVFFAADGAPLEPSFTIANQVGLLRSVPGHYVLTAIPTSPANYLQQRLGAVLGIDGIAPLDSLAAVKAQLAALAAPKDAT